MGKEHCVSLGEKTTSGVLASTGCFLHGILIITDGTHDVSVTIHDNASAASGKIIYKSVLAGSANFGGGMWPTKVKADNGLYLTLSGTGGSIIPYASYF